MRRLTPAAVLVAIWGIGAFAQAPVVQVPPQGQASPTPVVPIKGNGIVTGQVVDVTGWGLS